MTFFVYGATQASFVYGQDGSFTSSLAVTSATRMKFPEGDNFVIKSMILLLIVVLRTPL